MRVIFGCWTVCITVISFILCIAEDDIKEKLLIVGATVIFLAMLLFGLWLIGG